MRDGTPIKGRGTGRNHRSRFDSRTVDPTVDEAPEEGGRHPQSCYTAERARSLITRNLSPDIRFSQSINPYRGCEHVIFELVVCD
jgi:hypothetical protein